MNAESERTTSAVTPLSNQVIINEEQPWPGLDWFPETASSFFHGRARAIQDITRLVGTSQAAVLFGQSGLGKTSLINAGLFPELRRDDALPVYVRLDHAECAPPAGRANNRQTGTGMPREGC